MLDLLGLTPRCWRMCLGLKHVFKLPLPTPLIQVTSKQGARTGQAHATNKIRYESLFHFTFLFALVSEDVKAKPHHSFNAGGIAFEVYSQRLFHDGTCCTAQCRDGDIPNINTFSLILNCGYQVQEEEQATIARR
jgi:hypothetical protein